MKLSLTYFLLHLALYAAGSTAKGLAGAYERVFLYAVYRFEREAHTGTNGEVLGEGYIGQLCRGVKGGRCNTNEFLNWVNSGHPDEVFEFSPRGLEIDLTPMTVHDLAESIYSMPGQTDEFDTARVLGYRESKFSELFVIAHDAISEASQELRGARFPKDLLASAKEALQSSYEIRRGQYEEPLLNHLEARWPGDFASRDRNFRQMFFWTEVDWDATNEYFPELKDTKSEMFMELSEYMNDYQVENTEARNHVTIKNTQKKLLKTFPKPDCAGVS